MGCGSGWRNFPAFLIVLNQEAQSTIFRFVGPPICTVLTWHNFLSGPTKRDNVLTLTFCVSPTTSAMYVLVTVPDQCCIELSGYIGVFDIDIDREFYEISNATRPRHRLSAIVLRDVVLNRSRCGNMPRLHFRIGIRSLPAIFCQYGHVSILTNYSETKSLLSSI